MEEKALIFIGMGSNLGDRGANLEDALLALEKKGIRVAAVSSFYETEPLGMGGQPFFINAVCRVETCLSPDQLLGLCLETEKELGRVRGQRWGPRLIDLDLLLYGDRVINDGALTVPHPRLLERRFALLPLAELAGEFLHPVRGLAIRELLKSCPDRSSVVLAPRQPQRLML